MPTQPNGDRVTAGLSAAAIIAFLAAAPRKFRRRYCRYMAELIDHPDQDEPTRHDMAQRWRQARRKARRLRSR